MNKHIEFLGRALLVAGVLALLMKWNVGIIEWVIWGVVATVLVFWVYNTDYLTSK